MAIPIARPRVHLINPQKANPKIRSVVRSVPPPKAKPARIEVAGRGGALLKDHRKHHGRRPGSQDRQSAVLLGARPAVRNKPPPPALRRSGRIQVAHREQPVNVREQIEKIKSLKGRGQGKVLVMIACGPSLREAQDLHLLASHPMIDTMTINKPQPPLWPTKFWAFCDHTQYARNQGAFEDYNGILINSSSIKVSHPKQIKIRARQGKGFSTDLTQGFFIGRSTTFANMQTALYMGYEKIYLFGVDMCEIPGRPLWSYGVNPDVALNNRVQRFAAEAEHYQYAASSLLESDRMKFYFCSTYNPFPFIKSFNRKDQKTVVPEILAFAEGLR